MVSLIICSTAQAYPPASIAEVLCLPGQFLVIMQVIKGIRDNFSTLV